MANKVTGNQWGFASRRYPDFPYIFVLETKTFPERVADQLFVDPTFSGQAFAVMTQFAQVLDVGTALIVQLVQQSDGTPLDVSAATSLAIFLQRPDGTTVSKNAVPVVDGTDGRIYCLTTISDLTLSGVYSIQGKAVIGPETFRSSPLPFQVLDNIL